MKDPGTTIPASKPMIPWNRACEIADIWTPNQRCPFWTSGMDMEFTEKTCEHGEHKPHDIPPPPIGDPAATVKMLEWLLKHDDAHMMNVSSGYTYVLYRAVKDMPISEALAAAIVAIGEK